MAADSPWMQSAGPTDIWVRPRPLVPLLGLGAVAGAAAAVQGTPLFLGHCEASPKVEIDKVWLPERTSLGDVPFLKRYQGQVGAIMLLLNRLSENTLAVAESAPFHGQDGLPRGKTSRLARGALVGGDQTVGGLEVWLRFENFGTLQATPDLPAGVYFPAVTFEHLERDQLGTTTAAAGVVLGAVELYDRVARTFTLYSTDPADFALVPAQEPA